MSLSPVITSYEPFSRRPEYLAANRAFVETLPLRPGSHLFDLCCGTGVMTAGALEAQPRLRVTGMDLSAESLGINREGLDEAPARPDVTLVRGSADRLPFGDGAFDACLIGNAIHIFKDANALLRDIRRVLRPGGLFAFNSSFYAGTFAPGTERFYHEWVKRALLWVQERDRALRAVGGAGITRRRQAAGGAFSLRWRTGDEWSEALRAAGFDVLRTGERDVLMTQESFEAVGAYSGMAEVLLRGYPAEVASEALQSTVAPALRAEGVETVPRRWLEVAAVAA